MPMQRKVGRPSKYAPALVALVLNYAAHPKKYGDVVPTVEGACVEIGIGKKTYYEWCKQYEEFRNAADALMANQGRLLQTYGLGNKTNPHITKLLLSANHGMRVRTDVTSGGEKMFTVYLQRFDRPQEV
ncbi:MAG: hypothetical protein Greene041619_621 [Candidatus Peregrinibacteria bacterium Greene0416_19]|nr:MAG: hypothetical protein Greene041619_621 [Candidatus Peregrinibacteria bacterium Greene0416_19]